MYQIERIHSWFILHKSAFCCVYEIFHVRHESSSTHMNERWLRIWFIVYRGPVHAIIIDKESECQWAKKRKTKHNKTHTQHSIA